MAEIFNITKGDSKDYTEAEGVKIARKKTTIEKETEKRHSAAHDFVSHLPKTGTNIFYHFNRTKSIFMRGNL